MSSSRSRSLVIGSVGVLAGLVAAAFPAIGAARMRPVDALAGRFRVSNLRRTATPLAGLVVLGAGIASGLAANSSCRTASRTTSASSSWPRRPGSSSSSRRRCPARRWRWSARSCWSQRPSCSPRRSSPSSAAERQIPGGRAARRPRRLAASPPHRAHHQRDRRRRRRLGAAGLHRRREQPRDARQLPRRAAPAHDPPAAGRVHDSDGRRRHADRRERTASSGVSKAANAVASQLAGSHVYAVREPSDGQPPPRQKCPRAPS